MFYAIIIMNISLTLCDKKLIGDIPTHEFQDVKSSVYMNEPQMLFHHWLDKIDLKKSVLVCFENIRGLESDELRNEQQSFLISHKWEDITDFCDNHLNCDASYDINFAVFEFEDYYNAFKYCKDLKDGF